MTRENEKVNQLASFCCKIPHFVTLKIYTGAITEKIVATAERCLQTKWYLKHKTKCVKSAEIPSFKVQI